MGVKGCLARAFPRQNVKECLVSEQIKVLIVDDSAFARSLISKRLEANPQFTWLALLGMA